jgi:hypothetical protein
VPFGARVLGSVCGLERVRRVAGAGAGSSEFVTAFVRQRTCRVGSRLFGASSGRSKGRRGGEPQRGWYGEVSFAGLRPQPCPPQGKTLRCRPLSRGRSGSPGWQSGSGEARERRSREAGSTAAGGKASEGRTPGGHSAWTGFGRAASPLRRDQASEADGGTFRGGVQRHGRSGLGDGSGSPKGGKP